MITYDGYICGKTLLELGISPEIVSQSEEVFRAYPLKDILANPTISNDEKVRVISRLFPEEIKSFLCVMTLQGHIKNIDEIFESYEALYNKSKNILSATLYYVNKPDEKILKGFEETLKKKYKADGVVLECVEDKSLLGGYVLQAGDTRFDKSVSGSLKLLQNKLIRR